jgi:hypothetical protein
MRPAIKNPTPMIAVAAWHISGADHFSPDAAGLEALGAYHEKRDENREIGLGPEHDWSSHAADAFGLMCIAYRDPRELAAFNRKILEYPRMGDRMTVRTDRYAD